MDIEGAEIDVIKGMGDALLKSIQQITVEFHDFIPEMNLEEDVLRTISRLKSLDFACIVFSRKTHFDVLFLNKQFFSSSTILQARIIKYFHGIGRMIKRLYS
jgi:DNA repair protein RadC